MRVDSTQVTLAASLANEAEIKRLTLTKPAAVLRIEQVSFLEDGRLLEFTRATY